MTAEEAVRYLEEMYGEEPTYDRYTKVLEAIETALTLAYKTIKDLEWEVWHDGAEYCVFCHAAKHLDHCVDCPRLLALASIGEKQDD